jgi:DNA polymerase III subunit delta'
VSGLPAWGRDAREQPAAVQAMRDALRADEVAHAWLLVGPPGVGQEDLARSLAMALNCPVAEVADEACGTCDTCERIARDRDELLQVFEPEGAAYVVDNVREEWVATASRSLTTGRRRVLRITAADRTNVPAQNAFLKLLEEPPPSVVWLLEAEEESALLDTVLSRCRRLAVVPWGLDALRRRVREAGATEERIEALARAALGSPARLDDLLDADVAAARQRHLGLIDRLATGGPGQVVPAAKDIVVWAKGRVTPLKARHAARFEELERDFGVDERGRGWPPGLRNRILKRHERLERFEQRRALDLALDDVGSYLRDLLAVQAGAAETVLVNLDHQAELRRDAARLPAADAVAGLQAVARCREALDRNGNADLQLERLLMALALPLYRTSAA